MRHVRYSLHCGWDLLSFAWLVLIRLAWLAVPLVVLAFLVAVAFAYFSHGQWQYTISADTDVAVVDLPGSQETHWRVDGALLCVRDEPLDERYRYDAGGQTGASPCGGRSWRAYRLTPPRAAAAEPEAELVLTLGGGAADTTAATIHAVLESQPEGGLRLALRGSGGGERLGTLHAVGDDVAATLHSRANLVWPNAVRGDVPLVLVFPFVGEVTVGRDVSWSYNRMLTGGKLSVYTVSDEVAAKRVLVEEMELMLGDQVRLNRLERGGMDPIWPKGHFRYAATDGAGEGSPLSLAGIGLAGSVTVERFGGSRLEFRPGVWARLLHYNALVLISVLLAGLLTILGACAGANSYFLGGEACTAASRADLWRVCRKRLRRHRQRLRGEDAEHDHDPA